MGKKKKKKCYSGIGGQAVMEGIMMRNKNRYSIAVRKPDQTIEIQMGDCKQTESIWSKIPFVRGVYNFIDSLVVGIKAMSYSAEFYAESEGEETAFDRFLIKIFGAKAEKVIIGMTVAFGLLLAVALFFVLPWFLSALLERYISNASLIAILEGVIRLTIFILYVLGISLMKDIRRVFMYHGAEHKCINCIENGKSLNVKNIMKSSRMHKRCGTSFLLIVMVISIILFFFIRVDAAWMRLLLRIALVPVIAGISYEILRLAGKFDNWLVNIISAPGVALQLLTTREPSEDMVEVAIKAIESVFDWKAYLKENFEYDSSEEGWLDDDEADDETDEIFTERMHVKATIVVEPDSKADSEGGEENSLDLVSEETTETIASDEENTEEIETDITEEDSEELAEAVDTVADSDEADDIEENDGETEDADNDDEGEAGNSTEETIGEEVADVQEEQPSVEELNRLLEGFTGKIDLGDYK